jgi:histidinol phosphatase-like enzyme (inositol monophosphatase family)
VSGVGGSNVVDVDLNRAAEVVAALLPEAGAIALRWFRTDLVADDKGSPAGYDPVTEADRAIEAHLRAGILAAFPDHQVVGEEGGTSGGDGRTRWVIDPIDGTKAFVSGTLGWGTLIGLVVDDRPVAGWMHQPYLGETFSAVGADGWFERGKERRPLRTRATHDLSVATLYATHPSMFRDPDEVAAFERVATAARLQRYGGDCYAYALVALGHIDIVVESSLMPYDIVPLVPIIEAAGGVVTDRSGHTPLDGGFVIAAATPALHAQALALVNQET